MDCNEPKPCRFLLQGKTGKTGKVNSCQRIPKPCVRVKKVLNLISQDIVAHPLYGSEKVQELNGGPF